MMRTLALAALVGSASAFSMGGAAGPGRLWPISKKCTWCNEGTWHYGVKTQSACQTLAQKAASNHYTYKPGPKQCRINPKDTNGCSAHGSGYGSACTGNVHTKPGASGGSGLNGVHYTAHTGEAIIGLADVKLAGGKDHVTNITLGKCTSECSSRPTCKSFIFGGSNGYCEMWSKVGPTRSGMRGYVQYIKVAAHANTTHAPSHGTKAAPCGCEKNGVMFCNFDSGSFGTCEPCAKFTSKAQCLTDGLPSKGAADCSKRCFAGQNVGERDCANENGACKCNGKVKYGRNGKWSAFKAVSSTVACTNAVFGDPLPGVVKKCVCQPGKGVTSPPTTAATGMHDRVPTCTPAGEDPYSFTGKAVACCAGLVMKNENRPTTDPMYMLYKKVQMCRAVGGKGKGSQN